MIVTKIFQKILLSLIFSVLVVPLQAAVKTEIVDYRQGGQDLQGFLAFDDSFKRQLPGVLIVHQWNGLSEYERDRAKQLAKMGYVAFALDMYGKGILAEDHTKAAELSGIYRNNRKLMRGRAKAGLKVLRKHFKTDKDQLAAIGYCFGGTTVFEMARAGFDLLGVVSFHGVLGKSKPEKVKPIKTKVLIAHGANDPYMKPEEIKNLQDELNESGADWQMNYYSGAVHSFTLPKAGSDPSKGSAYNELADKRSWRAMQQFFNEIFK